MKNMKKKLMASVAMLVVSAIMMTSTSYAWYTINTKATVSGLDVTLAQTKNVEVAMIDMTGPTTHITSEVTKNDEDSQYNFGGTVTYTSQKFEKLDLPAIVATGTEKLADGVTDATASDVLGVIYGTDGRTDGYAKAMAHQDASGITYYDYEYLDGKKATIAFAYTMAVRTNIDGNLGVNVKYKQVQKTNGEGKELWYTSAEEKAKGPDSGTTTPTPGADDLKVMVDPQISQAKISISYSTTGYDADATVNTSEVTFSAGTTGSTSFAATANKVYIVKVFAYFDGETTFAKNMTKGDLSASIESITFENSNITSSLQEWEAAAALSELRAGDKKITGLNDKVTYQYSTDSTNWTDVSNKTEITGLTNDTLYTVRVKGVEGKTMAITPVAPAAPAGT